jgi:hypothetical protein
MDWKETKEKRELAKLKCGSRDILNILRWCKVHSCNCLTVTCIWWLKKQHKDILKILSQPWWTNSQRLSSPLRMLQNLLRDCPTCECHRTPPPQILAHMRRGPPNQDHFSLTALRISTEGSNSIQRASRGDI